MSDYEAKPVVRVARDLGAIVDLYRDLLIQAIHKAGASIDGHSLPGGEAMVALGGAAEPWRIARRVELHEERHAATCTKLDHTRCWTGSQDEDDTEPILQTLLFWSESWREEKGFPLDGRRPTVATEANVLRGLLEWAYETLPEWDDFERDIRTARARLENLLMAGRRTERGVPCLTCNVDLIRPARDRNSACDCGRRPVLQHASHSKDCPFWVRMEFDEEGEPFVVRIYDQCGDAPGRHVHARPDLACVACYREAEWDAKHQAHDRGGLRDEWVCPSCERRYDETDYRRAVAHAHFVSAEWLPLEDAMARTGAKRGSIWGWASKGVVRKRKDYEAGRMTYHVGDIEGQMGDDDEVA